MKLRALHFHFRPLPSFCRGKPENRSKFNGFRILVLVCRWQSLTDDILELNRKERFEPDSKSGYRAMSSLNDLEFAYAPVRDQVRDLREYL